MVRKFHPMHKFHPARVAEKLGVSRRTIDRLCRRGQLRKVIVSPRRVYVDPQSLKELLGEAFFAKLFDESTET
jgi:predicted site-specific integrase-resolvase